ncbi:hypothetical protein KC949_04050, partial [Candidatus Saccharibacteria bacterium]|nr:hypothetical protein [Candidatus Saccharibacteria bacterium]
EQYTKLFKYIEDFRSEVNEKLDQKADKSDLDRLISTMDSYFGRLEDHDVEQAARDAKFARLLDWAREVSKKTGVPLPEL